MSKIAYNQYAVSIILSGLLLYQVSLFWTDLLCDRQTALYKCVLTG